jgi:hypothetical protein
VNGSGWTGAWAADAAAPGDQATLDPIGADAEGLVELELKRLPDRCDTRIARLCGTDVWVVREVRERLGAYPTRPA